MTAGLVPPRTVTALYLCCPTAHPTHSQQHWQAPDTAPQDLAPQATSRRISPINLRAGSSFPSSQEIPAQPEIQVFKGKASEPEVPFCTGHPQPSHQALDLRGTRAAHCPQTQQGKEAPGALIEGYVGHHLGTTVKDRTQQDSIPNAVVQSSETLHMPRLPQAQLINNSTEMLRQDRKHQTI